MNFRNSYQIELLTIVYIFLLMGCQKKDTVRPQLTIYNPLGNSQYYAQQNNIYCSGKATDETALDRVEIQLQTISGNPVLPKVIRFADANSFTYNIDYSLDNIHLESGNYMIKTTAYDKAGNSFSIYREVLIYGVPRVKQGVFYVAENGGSYTLGRIDSLDEDSTAIGVYPDYGGMAINNYDQQLFYMGYESVDLLAFNSRNYSIEWILPNLANPPGTYYFHQLNFSEDYLTISLFDDQILKRYKNGTGSGNILLNYIGGQPETSLKKGNYLYVESKSLGTAIRKFQRYFFSTGTLDEDFSIPFDFKKIFSKNDDELLIFGESGGQAHVRVFFENGGNYFQPINLFAGNFVDALQIDNNRYLIVQNGGVYAYTYSTNNLIQEITESNILSADYNSVNDQIYLGFANMIKVYSSSGALIRNIPVSGNVVNLKIHFNK
ncbi:MAG: hypothetical protein R2799_10275 [Crocinitomicaceae bacterium]